MNRGTILATVYRQRQADRDHRTDQLFQLGLVLWIMLMIAWVNT